jgi:hypothetical protein
MVDKAHVVVWRSVIVEEWLVEGEKTAAAAREAFLDGACRLVSRSEFDRGKVLRVRLAEEIDIENAEAHQPLSSFAGLSASKPKGVSDV